jgi:hypothetical protein
MEHALSNGEAIASCNCPRVAGEIIDKCLWATFETSSYEIAQMVLDGLIKNSPTNNHRGAPFLFETRLGRKYRVYVSSNW